MNKYWRTTLWMIGLLSVFVIRPAAAQQVTIDSTQIRIGSHAALTLSFEVDKNTHVKWPVFLDTLATGVEVINSSNVDTIPQGNNLLLKQVITVTSFDTGFVRIPAVAFITEKDGKTDTLLTQPLQLQVNSIDVDTNADIRDIKPVMKAPITFQEILPWLLVAAAVVGGIFALRYYIRRRKQNKPIIPVPVKAPRPAFEIALDELETIRRESIWKQGRVKEYYTDITDVIRRYFENRYRIPAVEMTSDEILEASGGIIRHEREFNKLSDLLTLADLVKFAKAFPNEADHRDSLENAIHIVRYTIPPATAAKQPERAETPETDNA